MAEVLPGFSPRGAVEHNPAGTHQVISTRHLSEGDPYRFVPEHSLRLTPDRDASKYVVKPGDVLFVSRGTRNIAVEIVTVPDPTITTTTFYVLRPREDAILPGYLAWCLNQTPIRAIVDEIRTGAGTPIVPRQAFAQVQIPAPSLEEQKAFVALARLQSRERNLRQQLLETTESLHRATGTALLHGLGRTV